MKRIINQHNRCLYIIVSLLVMIACRKDFPAVNDPTNSEVAANFEGVFENFWNGMNYNYIFWDTDTTNWDEMYRKYQPLFAKLDIENREDVKTAHRYFQEMTASLIDCHFSLNFNSKFNLPSINPALERKKKSVNYHLPISRNFYFASVFNRYCKDENKMTGTEQGLTIVSATIEQNIVYLYISAFRLTEIYEENKNGPAKKSLENFFNLLKSTANIRGVILDVRDNGGGYLSDLNLLIGRMIDKRLDIGYTRCKMGEGRLDYSPWIPAYVTPQANATKVSVPIVILGNMFSASMAEMTIMAVQTLPNGYFVGEQTWGAQGPLVDISANFNSGIFACPPFLTEVKTSSHVLKNMDGKLYENIGIKPNVEVRHNQYNLTTEKRDVQLEQAIDLIKKLPRW